MATCALHVSTSPTNPTPPFYTIKSVNHLSNFDQLFKCYINDDFADVLLSTRGQRVKFHRCVLAALSPFFKSLLQEACDCDELLICMDEVADYEQLLWLQEFCYNGEVELAKHKFHVFEQTLERFQILCPNSKLAFYKTKKKEFCIPSQTVTVSGNGNIIQSSEISEIANRAEEDADVAPPVEKRPRTELPADASHDNKAPNGISELVHASRSQQGSRLNAPKCEICGRTFRNTGALNFHKNVLHQNHIAYKNPDERMVRDGTLRFGSKPKNYVPYFDDCQSTTFQYVRRENKDAELEEFTMSRCPICRFQVLHKDWDAHMKTLHKGYERPLPTGSRNRIKLKIRTDKQHEKVVGGKWVRWLRICSICCNRILEEDFPEHFERHRTKNNEKDNEEFVRRTLICPICQTYIPSQTELTVHVRDAHNTRLVNSYIKDIKCPVCDAVFPSDKKKLKHLETAHPGAQDTPATTAFLLCEDGCFCCYEYTRS